jgi:RHS repeat-associated protein
MANDRSLWTKLFSRSLPPGRRKRHQLKRNTRERLSQRALRLESLETRRLLAAMYWDPDGDATNNDILTGAGLGGSGSWANGGSAVWYNPTTGTHVSWNNANGDQAVFAGTAGTVTVDSGIAVDALGFSTTGYLLQSGSLALGGGAVDIGSGVSATISTPLVGSNSLSKTGDGTLTLSGASSYSGGTTIGSGTLRLAHTSAAGTGVIAIGDGTLSLFRSGSTTTFANAITSLAGTSGALVVDGSEANAGTGVNSTYATGTITVDGTLMLSRPLGGNGHTFFSGLLAGGGTLIVGNANGGVAPSTTAIGRAQLNNAGNTFNGSVQILAGGNFLNIKSAPSYASVDIAASGYMTIIGGTTTTVGSLNGAGAITKNISSNTATLAIGAGGADGNFSGVIAENLLKATGAVAVTKLGDGTQILSGELSYTGTTVITDGVLELNETATVLGRIIEAGGVLAAPGIFFWLNLSGMTRGESISTTSVGQMTVLKPLVSAREWFLDWRAVINSSVTGYASCANHSGAFPGSEYFRVDSVAVLSGVPKNDLRSLKNSAGQPRLQETDRLIVWEDWTDFEWDDFYWVITATAIVAEVVSSDELASDSCPDGCSDMAMTEGGDSSSDVKVASGVQAKYQTGVNPHPIVRVTTSLPTAYGTAPDSITATLTFGGVDQGTVYYSGAGFSPGDEVLFAMQADATGWASGRYGWDMVVRYRYGTQDVYRVFTGVQDIISRSDSELGAGLSITEIDRLDIKPTGVNLITGSNHAIWFAGTGSGPYTREAGDLTFSTLVKNGDGTYTLTSATGMKSNFSATGLLTSRVDTSGNARTYAYNLDVKIASITDHVGRAVTFNYTDDRISSVVDFDGTTTTLAYDTAGNLVSVTEPDPDGAGPLAAPVTTYAYDAVTGLLTTIVDPRGEVTTMEYDHAGKLSRIVQPCGGISNYSMYRSLGVVDLAIHGSSELNPAPLVSSESYEVQRDELGAETYIKRDRFGNVVWQQDALGNVTTIERNADGLATLVTEPDPDGAGPLGPRVTQYEYDSRGNLTKRINPDLTEETWTYDPTFSQATSYTNQLGRQTLWSIDPTNGLVLSTTRVVGAIDSLLNGETDDVTTSQTYTTGLGGVPAGLVETMTDALGRVTSYSYTTNGLIETIVEAVGTLDEATTSFEYDASDNLTAVVDAIGRRTEYAYDNLDRMISMTQAATPGPGPEQHFWQFAYDAAGNRTHVTDPLGNVTEYVYDERGRLSEVIQADPDGAGPLESPVTTYDFNCVNNLVGIADALGRETTYEYDALRRMVRAISPDPDGAGPEASPTTETAYNAIGWVTSTTSALGNVTSFEYDVMGRVVSITQADPDGAGPLTAPFTTFTYDAAGQRLTSTDPLGRVTTYEYDDLGRTTKITSPDPDSAGPELASWTVFAYDKAGNLLSTTNRLGNTTAYAYDNLDRMVSITEADPDGAGPLASPVTTYTFDAAGQRLTSTDPLGRVTTFEYDDLGRLAKMTEPDPDGAGPELAAWAVYTYDAVGNVLTESDRLGNTTTYAYDNLYRLTSSTDANGGITAYTYDPVGNRLSLTDPVGNTTSWVFDGLNRVIEEENELGASRFFAYDLAGNLIQRTDRNGRVTQFTYDNLERRTTEEWMDGLTVVKELSWSYDAANQIVSAGDGTADYTYQYDGAGRITQSQFDFAALAQPVTLGQTFDAASRRTSLFASIGATADFKNDFGYDSLNRLTGLTQQGQTGGNAVAEKRINFAFLADGRTSEISRFADVAGTQNVANTTFGYDGAGRLTALTHAKDTTSFAGYGWTYDVANRLTSFTNSVYVAEDAVYTHDDLGQLTGADRTGSGDDEAYIYDENGNRITANGDTYTTGTNNRVLSDGTNSYLYDAEGNITRITNIATGDHRNLAWDYRNRLTKVTQFDASDVEQWRVEYVYDAYNRMVGRTEFTGGTSTPLAEDIFIYDGYQMALKLDASGNVESRTLWGAGTDQILATEDSSGNVTWPLTDHLNTVRDIVSYDSGTDTTALENHVVYDSFGKVTSETNPSVASDFKFTARYTDATTGLQWNLNRWYSPSLGRWMSEDPIGFAAGDRHLSRYVNNHPLSFVDPAGLQTVDGPDSWTNFSPRNSAKEPTTLDPELFGPGGFPTLPWSEQIVIGRPIEIPSGLGSGSLFCPDDGLLLFPPITISPESRPDPNWPDWMPPTTIPTNWWPVATLVPEVPTQVPPVSGYPGPVRLPGMGGIEIELSGPGGGTITIGIKPNVPTDVGDYLPHPLAPIDEFWRDGCPTDIGIQGVWPIGPRPNRLR